MQLLGSKHTNKGPVHCYVDTVSFWPQDFFEIQKCVCEHDIVLVCARTVTLTL